MGENVSCCYVGSGTKATVRSRLTLKSTFKLSDLRIPNYKWCISLRIKIVLDVVNFTIYKVKDSLSIPRFKIKFCTTEKEL